MIFPSQELYPDQLPLPNERLIMKDGIHPKYFETQVTCGCGNSFKTRSTRKELKVDICNVCHPFYTGKLKFVDTAGRIEKFQNNFAAGTYASLQNPKKPAAKKK
jgi:large subunit ribosomal protein L31